MFPIRPNCFKAGYEIENWIFKTIWQQTVRLRCYDIHMSDAIGGRLSQCSLRGFPRPESRS